MSSPQQIKSSRAYYKANREIIRQKAKEHYASNRQAAIEYQKRWYNNHRDRVIKYRRSDRYKLVCKQWRKRRAKHILNSRLKYKYGITLEGYNEMLISQKGVCAICSGSNNHDTKWGTRCVRLHVDHCEETKKVRGLLCHNCNVSIGLLYHNPLIVKAALEYLTK